jgi:hypothetical protein
LSQTFIPRALAAFTGALIFATSGAVAFADSPIHGLTVSVAPLSANARTGSAGRMPADQGALNRRTGLDGTADFGVLPKGRYGIIVVAQVLKHERVSWADDVVSQLDTLAGLAAALVVSIPGSTPPTNASWDVLQSQSGLQFRRRNVATTAGQARYASTQQTAYIEFAADGSHRIVVSVNGSNAAAKP